MSANNVVISQSSMFITNGFAYTFKSLACADDARYVVVFFSSDGRMWAQASSRLCTVKLSVESSRLVVLFSQFSQMNCEAR